MDMLPPEMYLKKTTVKSEGSVYKVPFTVQGKAVDLIISIEMKWTIC